MGAGRDAGAGAGRGDGGLGTGEGAGCVAHAASIARHAAIDPRAIERMVRAPIECEAFVRLAIEIVLEDLSSMWILVVEAMIAVGLLLFIVWWTLGPTQRREREEMQRLAGETHPPPPLKGEE